MFGEHCLIEGKGKKLSHKYILFGHSCIKIRRDRNTVIITVFLSRLIDFENITV